MKWYIPASWALQPRNWQKRENPLSSIQYLWMHSCLAWLLDIFHFSIVLFFTYLWANKGKVLEGVLRVFMKFFLVAKGTQFSCLWIFQEEEKNPWDTFQCCAEKLEQGWTSLNVYWHTWNETKDTYKYYMHSLVWFQSLLSFRL